jgi:hypothetical protein
MPRATLFFRGIGMSDHVLSIIGAICGVVGALADVTIVILMVIERPRTVGNASRRRYWPWLLAIALTTIATVAPAYFIYRLTTSDQPTAAKAASPISASIDVKGGIQSIRVPSMEMPYEAFCNVDWNSSCSPQQKGDGFLILSFQVTAPHDGGAVSYTVTPIDPLKAYRQEAAKVIDREATIKDLQSQVKQQAGKIETLTPQLSAWSAYHDKVVGVITDLEKQNCGQQAIDAQKIIDATQADMARLNVELQREKLQYPSQPHVAVYSDLNRDQLQLQNEQAAIQVQSVINSRLDTIRSAP